MEEDKMTRSERGNYYATTCSGATLSLLISGFIGQDMRLLIAGFCCSVGTLLFFVLSGISDGGEK